jgi:hypothetical protein
MIRQSKIFGSRSASIAREEAGCDSRNTNPSYHHKFRFLNNYLELNDLNFPSPKLKRTLINSSTFTFRNSLEEEKKTQLLQVPLIWFPPIFSALNPRNKTYYLSISLELSSGLFTLFLFYSLKSLHFIFSPIISMLSSTPPHTTEKRKLQWSEAQCRKRGRDAIDNDREPRTVGRHGILSAAEEDIVLTKLKDDFKSGIFHTVLWFIQYVCFLSTNFHSPSLFISPR